MQVKMAPQHELQSRTHSLSQLGHLSIYAFPALFRRNATCYLNGRPISCKYYVVSSRFWSHRASLNPGSTTFYKITIKAPLPQLFRAEIDYCGAK